MPASEQYLYRCIETMKADPALSDETKILMFIEYARLVVEEKKYTTQAGANRY